MQCINCGFENLPGLRDCGRCGSSLSMGEISVEPGRASALRLRTRFSQAGNVLGTRLGCLARTKIQLPRFIPRSSSPQLWPALIRSIVPGMGQRYLRHRTLGWIMFGFWLAFLFGALLAIPNPSSFWLLSGAVIVHASAFISLFAHDLSHERIAMRALFGGLLFLGLRAGVYAPLTGLAARFWTPMTIPYNYAPGPVLQAGDGILYEGAWRRPAEFSRGDLVVYEIPRMMGAGYYSHEGFGIDRIVAVPGDEVRIENGRLWVNGATPPANEAPLGNIPILSDMSFIVVKGEYVILPSRLNMGGPADVLRTFFNQVIRVHDVNVIGRVRMILKPWSRFGRVE